MAAKHAGTTKKPKTLVKKKINGSQRRLNARRKAAK
jgi:hypothetical protein